MSERYAQISVDKTRLYISGSPVVLEAQALLKDNTTDEAIAQLKFQSITHKIIKALTIGLRCFDVMGNELQSVSSFQYLDLDIKRDAKFGQDTPVPLPDKNTRSFTVINISVIYQDDGVWTSEEDATWRQLPEKTMLASELGGSSLYDQYRRDITDKAIYYPQEYEDLWLCACGYENRNDEVACHNCHTSKSKVFNGLDTDVLRENLKKHEEELAEKRTAEEMTRLAKRYRQRTWLKKNKTRCVVGGVAAILLLVLITSVTSCGSASSDTNDSGSGASSKSSSAQSSNSSSSSNKSSSSSSTDAITESEAESKAMSALYAELRNKAATYKDLDPSSCRVKMGTIKYNGGAYDRWEVSGTVYYVDKYGGAMKSLGYSDSFTVYVDKFGISTKVNGL